MPEEEDCGEGLELGDMAQVTDLFQAVAVYKRCVQQFREALKVGNVVARLVLAHDSKLVTLEEVDMGSFEANTIVF